MRDLRAALETPTHTDTHTQTHRHTDTHTQTHTHTHTDRHTKGGGRLRLQRDHRPLRVVRTRVRLVEDHTLSRKNQLPEPVRGGGVNRGAVNHDVGRNLRVSICIM